MSDTKTGCDIRAVAARMRPFVARRVAVDDVDDVLQEILVRVHDGFDRIDDEEQFARWLHTVSSNVIADHHRRRVRRDRKHQSFATEWTPDVPSGADAHAEFTTFVEAFVAMLPSPYREALTLTELEGLGMREAAERESISESGMKSRVQRGRRMLRELFEACCEIALDARGRITEYTPKIDR